MGNTTTPLRLRFNNRKFFYDDMKEVGREFVVNICMRIFGHIGLGDVSAQIIDITIVRDPTARESF